MKKFLIGALVVIVIFTAGFITGVRAGMEALRDSINKELTAHTSNPTTAQ